MDMKIELLEQPEQLTFALRKTAKTEELQKIIPEKYAQLYAYLTQTGGEITATPYVAYFTQKPQTELLWDMEIGFPVAKALHNAGEILMGQIPAMQAAVITYRGAYSGIGAAYDAILKWIEENNYVLTGKFYEFYLNDPSTTPENELATKIVIPCKQNKKTTNA